MSDTLELTSPALRSAVAPRLRAYVELTKPRIMGLVLVVTAVGFALAVPGQPGSSHAWVLFHVLLGTGLVAGGANALNQYVETVHDARMRRTQDRPLPSGRLTRRDGLVFGSGLTLSGLAYLLTQTNELCAMLATLTVLSYVLAYTPLKRITPFCVYVGAVPGALPPVIGWAGAAGTLSIEAWCLFAILFFWQLPHFAAIAWQHREDYARAGYPMLAVVDSYGWRTNLHVVTHSVGLIVASLLPVWAGMSGPVYAVSAMLLGAAFLASGFCFLARKTSEVARLHVLASIAYLPLLLGLMMIDRAPG